MRQRVGSTLVQIMACRLFGTKSLSQPMLVYCQSDPWEQISVEFQSKYQTFHSGKYIWKYRLSKWRPFCPGGGGGGGGGRRWVDTKRQTLYLPQAILVDNVVLSVLVWRLYFQSRLNLFQLNTRLFSSSLEGIEACGARYLTTLLKRGAHIHNRGKKWLRARERDQSSVHVVACDNIGNAWPIERRDFILPVGDTLCYPVWDITSTQDGRHFADDIFKYTFYNKNIWIRN